MSSFFKQHATFLQKPTRTFRTESTCARTLLRSYLLVCDANGLDPRVGVAPASLRLFIVCGSKKKPTTTRIEPNPSHRPVHP